MRFRTLAAFVVAVALAGSASAGTIITQWNFNSVPPDNNLNTGTLNPNIGNGTLALVGGVTSPGFLSGAVNGGSSDPATSDNSAWQTTTYASQGQENKMRGVEFLVSTVGYQDIEVSWDQRHSNTSSRWVQFQYTIDGTTWVDSALFEGNRGDAWFNNRTVNLSAITGVNDNARFGVRIVATFAPGTSSYAASNSTSSYAPTGTWRFDMVTIRGNTLPPPPPPPPPVIPEPASFVALSIGLVGVAGFRYLRRQV